MYGVSSFPTKHERTGKTNLVTQHFEVISSPLSLLHSIRRLLHTNELIIQFANVRWTFFCQLRADARQESFSTNDGTAWRPLSVVQMEMRLVEDIVIFHLAKPIF